MHVQDQWKGVPYVLGWRICVKSVYRQAMHVVYTLKYKLGLLYVMRKLLDVRKSEGREWIPVKMSKETLVKSERVWRLATAEMGLPFKRLTLGDIKVPWASDPKLCKWGEP